MATHANSHKSKGVQARNHRQPERTHRESARQPQLHFGAGRRASACRTTGWRGTFPGCALCRACPFETLCDVTRLQVLALVYFLVPIRAKPLHRVSPAQMVLTDVKAPVDKSMLNMLMSFRPRLPQNTYWPEIPTPKLERDRSGSSKYTPCANVVSSPVVGSIRTPKICVRSSGWEHIQTFPKVPLRLSWVEVSTRAEHGYTTPLAGRVVWLRGKRC